MFFKLCNDENKLLKFDNTFILILKIWNSHNLYFFLQIFFPHNFTDVPFSDFTVISYNGTSHSDTQPALRGSTTHSDTHSHTYQQIAVFHGYQKMRSFINGCGKSRGMRLKQIVEGNLKMYASQEGLGLIFMQWSYVT